MGTLTQACAHRVFHLWSHSASGELCCKQVRHGYNVVLSTIHREDDIWSSETLASILNFLGCEVLLIEGHDAQRLCSIIRIWSGNNSATWATTTPEDAGECVSERPLSGRFHQVRTPSVHGHFHQVRTPSVHGTIRPFRPRQRPSMQPTASPSARVHLLRTLKNYKVRICFGHKQNYKAHHQLPSSLP